MMDRHETISGTPPFQNAVVPPDQLRRACEVQAKGHLIHLRQGWLQAGGHDDVLAALMVRSAAPLRVLLEHVARIHGTTAAGENDLALAGARVAGLPAPLIRDVLTLEEAPEHGARLVRHLPEYLAASEQLWTFVDRWSVGS